MVSLKIFMLQLMGYEKAVILFTQENSSLSYFRTSGNFRLIFMAKALFHKEINNTTLALCELSLAEIVEQRLLY